MRHLTSRPTTRLTVAVATAAFVLAGCGGDDAGGAAAPTDSPETTEAPAEDDAPDEEELPEDEAPTSEDESAADEGATAAIEVELRDDDGFVFAPTDVSVEVGATVTWVHEGRISHTVTASDGSFASGTIGAGDTFEVTFDQPGTYPYVCDFHGSMRGTVEVT